MLNEFLFIAIRGICHGAIFSLVAISFNLIVNATTVVNFAQGASFVLAGFVAAAFLHDTPTITTWFAVSLLVMLASALWMVIQGYIILLPLRFSSEQDSWLITTMAISVIIGAIILLTKGPYEQVVKTPFPAFTFAGTRTPAPYLLCVALAVFWYFALRLFMNKTRVGLAMSAIAQDFDAALAAGIRVRPLQLLSFAISGIVIGSAGFVAAPIVPLTPDSHIGFVVSGFIAAVIGGLGNNLGALIGGPILGLISVAANYTVGNEYQSAVALVLLVGVLLFRPEGFLGRTSARRV